MLTDMGRNSRKKCPETTSPKEQPLVANLVPAHLALAAFRAALAADARIHGSRDALDPCVVDYLGKITQSVLRHSPNSDDLQEALLPILMGANWEEARVRHVCDIIWKASQKASARHDVQADACKDLAIQGEALLRAREILAEHNANEMAQEEEKAELRKQRKLRRAEKRAQKARSGSHEQPEAGKDEPSSGGDSDHDNTEQYGACSDTDEPKLECSMNSGAEAEMQSHKEISSSERPLEVPSDSGHRSASGLTWIVSNHSCGKETVWTVQESPQGTLTDLKIVEFSDASPQVRPCPKRLSATSSQSTDKSLTYSDETTEDFKSFEVSEDTDPAGGLPADSDGDLSRPASVLNDRRPWDFDAELWNHEMSPLVIEETTHGAVPISSCLPSKIPPRLNIDASRNCGESLASERWPKHIPATSCPPSPDPLFVQSGFLGGISSAPSGYPDKTDSSNTLSRLVTPDVWQNEQDGTPLASFTSPKNMLLWPNTPIDSPCCGFNLPPPLPPIPPLEALMPSGVSKADATSGPFQRILHPGVAETSIPDARQVVHSPVGQRTSPTSGVGLDVVAVASHDDADAKIETIDSYHQQIMYIPVLFPHPCSHRGQECTGAPALPMSIGFNKE